MSGKSTAADALVIKKPDPTPPQPPSPLDLSLLNSLLDSASEADQELGIATLGSYATSPAGQIHREAFLGSGAIPRLAALVAATSSRYVVYRQGMAGVRLD